MTFIRGTFGLDSADPSASQGVSTAYGSGARFWCRYLAGDGDTAQDEQFKLVKDGEVAALAIGGISAILNFEQGESTPTLGAAKGAACGAADLARAKEAGYAQGSSIYISWEPGNDSSQWANVEAFIRAYDAALGGYYHADGLYASIATLKHFAALGLVKHGWIPESCSAAGIPKLNLSALGISAPPAVTTWDLCYMPTKSQLPIAMAYLDTLVAGSGLESIIWQTGNKWFSGHTADEDVVLLGGPLGSHLEQGSAPQPPPVPPTPPTPVSTNPIHGHAVPALIARGSGQYLGSISGPAASHGGINPAEKAIVKLWQQFLIWNGDVPGVSNVESSWADGVFDRTTDRPGQGPTSSATAAYQRRYMPGTTLPGQVWWDDWTKAASL